jgi:hypothetical protein
MAFRPAPLSFVRFLIAEVSSFVVAAGRPRRAGIALIPADNALAG